MRSIVIKTPEDFNYQAVLFSHGWYQLRPFHYDADSDSLYRIHQLSDGSITRLHITANEGEICVNVEGIDILSDAQCDEIEQMMRRCFSIDWDMSGFYAFLDGKPDYVWVIREQYGRIMVSPTVWEDLAKTLFTTNTTWSQTVGMVERLCTLGTPCPEGGYIFPTPEQVLALSPEELTAHTRSGYRAPYLHELATTIVSGALDVEAWVGGDLSSDDLYKAVKALKGFGDYAAGTIVRLLGHFDRLAIDSVCRDAFARFYNNGEKADDKSIRAYYEPFAEWRGLAMWMDVMRKYEDGI